MQHLDIINYQLQCHLSIDFHFNINDRKVWINRHKMSIKNNCCIVQINYKSFSHHGLLFHFTLKQKASLSPPIFVCVCVCFFAPYLIHSYTYMPIIHLQLINAHTTDWTAYYIYLPPSSQISILINYAFEAIRTIVIDLFLWIVGQFDRYSSMNLFL